METCDDGDVKEPEPEVAEETCDDGDEKGTEPEVAELRLKVESLKQELETCKAELVKLHKQLNQSERLQRSTESYNEDLRKQVDKLSADIHDRKKKEKSRVDGETQTEEYTWTESDYHNYYYGGYQQNAEATDVSTEGLDAANEAVDVSLPDEVTVNVSASSDQHENNTAAKTEETDGGSIADLLRATAEQAMTQTGFVFDETTGMYYDHSTSFYYDSTSQLYYDNNTGIYYCYDAESGRYQFHSKIELPSTQTAAESCQDKRTTEKKAKTCKKGSRKTYQDDKDAIKMEEDEIEWVERPKKTTVSRKRSQRSPTPDSTPRRKDKSKSRDNSERGSSKRKKQKNGSRSDDRGRSKKKKSKSDKHKKRKKTGRSTDDSSGNSEPEEGEISTESEGEWASTPSWSSSAPESEMESENKEVIWPPCIRVTVVRSPVLTVGTLFIITADSSATIGREKDMDHAIRIPEMGVSKFHAEVYFDQDQQGYMLVDQGSQNGTVINGNRILQPKTKCEPCALTHGDEVKMGETVLSFHIHSGTDTCDGCEPGQVIAHLSKHKRHESAGPVLSSQTKEEKEALRQKELKQIKAKYGLQSSEYEEAKARRNLKYKDRAESRRQTVGSEGVFKRDDAPASVHVEISGVNKGRKMLEKMGWKKGDGLGKDGTGMKDPIDLKIRKSQSGLGAGVALSVDEASLTRSRTQKNWEKARERFADSCQPDTVSSKTQKDITPRLWVVADKSEETNTPGD